MPPRDGGIRLSCDFKSEVPGKDQQEMWQYEIPRIILSPACGQRSRVPPCRYESAKWQQGLAATLGEGTRIHTAHFGT